jgi:hypothetical protein
MAELLANASTPPSWSMTPRSCISLTHGIQPASHTLAAALVPESVPSPHIRSMYFTTSSQTASLRISPDTARS